MTNHIDKKVQKQIDDARNTFAELLKKETSAGNLTIDFLIKVYGIICDHYSKGKNKDGKKTWVAEEPIKTLIEPFEKKFKKNAKRLPFTALVQMLQMEKPAKMLPEFNARNFKYTATVTIAKINGWNKQSFSKEIKKEGGMTRLVNLYSKHVNNEKGDATTTVVTKNIEDFENIEKKVWKTAEPLPEEYKEKVVIARAHKQGFEILRKFPTTGKLTFTVKK